MSAEDIVNARDINVLTDHLSNLRKMYTEENGRDLPLHDLFKRAQIVFQKHEIALSSNGLRKIKEVVKRRDYFEMYCAKFLKAQSCDELAAIIKNQNLAKQVNSSDEIDVDYPLTLQYGILIVWCGCAMDVLSAGTLHSAASWVISTGVAMTIQGTIEYQNDIKKAEQARAERKRLEIEKENRKLQKESAKIEKKRLKKIERKNRREKAKT